MCQSEICVSHVSTVVLSKWLSDTTLIRNRVEIITPGWKTADGNTLLQLVCQSKTTASQISSTILTKWLNDSTTTLDVMKINFTPDLRTADGVTLFQLICQSEKCLIQISSTVFLKWLRKNPLILVSISIPDCKTADGDTLLQLILQSEVSVSKTTSTVLSNLLSDSRKISVDQMKMVHPNWKTLDGSHFLHALCQSNIEDTKIIELMQHYMLKHGLNPDTFLDGEGNTALHIACQVNKFAVVSYLIDQAHCDPNKKNREGRLPLDMTTNPEVINYLCQHDHIAIYSMTLVKWMKELRSIDDVTMLSILKSLVENHSYRTEDGSTLLHVFVHMYPQSHSKLNMKFVDFLLSECHCDPNCLDSIGETPLQNSHLEMAKMLIKHGAKVSPRQVLEFEAKESVPMTPTLMKLMLTTWNPDDKDSDGYTALHLACKNDKYTTVILLLSVAHCDPNIKSNNAEVPLQMTSDLRIIKELIEYGAKMTKEVVFKLIASINIADSRVSELFTLSTRKETMLWKPSDLDSIGYTALHLACKLNRSVIVNYLLTEAKCDPNITNDILNLLESPLELTINLEIAKELIKHGARVTPGLVLKFEAMEDTSNKDTLIKLMLMTWNPDDRNSDGYTALHLACKAGRPTTVNILLSIAQCDPNIKGSSDGYTPLHIACKADYPTIINHLLSVAHCDPNIQWRSATSNDNKSKDY